MEHQSITPTKGQPVSGQASESQQIDPRATGEVSQDAQLQILQELKILVALQMQATKSPPLISQFLYNFLLQLVGLTLATIFGAFSILAWKASEDASKLAAQANELTTQANDQGTSASCDGSVDSLISIFEFCQTRPPSALNETCAFLLDRFQDSSSEVVDSFAVWVQDTVSHVDSCFGGAATTLPPPSVPPSAEPSSGGNRVNRTMIGAIVGAVLAALPIAISLFYLKFRAYQSHTKRWKGPVILNSHIKRPA